MLEILMTGNGGEEKGADKDPLSDQLTDITSLKDQYAVGTKSLFVTPDVAVGGGGGIAVYDNQLITIQNNQIIYYDLSTKALIKKVNISPAINVGLNNTTHQYGKLFFIGLGRNSASKIYMVNLETSLVSELPTTMMQKGSFYAYGGGLYHIGGFVDSKFVPSTIYKLEINSPTQWVAEPLKTPLVHGYIGASCLFASSGFFVIAGGGYSTTGTETDGGNYSNIYMINPSTKSAKYITSPRDIVSLYHNPIAVLEDKVFQLYRSGSWYFYLTNNSNSYTFSPAPLGFHNDFGQVEDVVFFTDGYNQKPINITVLQN